MKKKNLEILLQKIPEYTKPSPQLEQYITPAGIAADIVFTAYQFNDIENKKIVDLGCGTGIFSVAAKILGAEKVIGFDIDKDIINIAKEYAEDNNYDIDFYNKRIQDIQEECDTILMNPPFGAQKSNKNADRAFLEKAFEISSVVYSLHLSKTIPFIEKMIKSMQGEITFYKNFVFPIKHSYDFHDKKTKNFDVTLVRILTNI